MVSTTLKKLFEHNARHVDSLPTGYFSAVEAEQEPAAVSMCCADSRVSQEGMWDVETPGWLFTPSTIGNQIWDRHDGELVIDGSLLYPLVFTDTQVALVVGHTGCGAVTAALAAARGEGKAAPKSVGKWVDLLVPVIQDGLEDDRIDPEREVGLVDQLVEYNVDRQVDFLLESDDVPDDISVYGFVYDFQGVYGYSRGQAYLVNADGQTAELADRVPEGFEDHTARLL